MFYNSIESFIMFIRWFLKCQTFSTCFFFNSPYMWTNNYINNKLLTVPSFLNSRIYSGELVRSAKNREINFHINYRYFFTLDNVYEQYCMMQEGSSDGVTRMVNLMLSNVTVNYFSTISSTAM